MIVIFMRVSGASYETIPDTWSLEPTVFIPYFGGSEFVTVMIY